MSTAPRITFGVIVLNGEPFTRYCLRSIYPFAHEIIVVEGAAPAATGIATADGHSTDATLAVLREFQRTEDPQQKLTIVTAEDEGLPDGFWPGEKHQQSQAYARRATGDFLWQVDIDEFYRDADLRDVCGLLARDPSIDAISFLQRTFWGDLETVVDGWYLRQGAAHCHRIFRWGPGYEYVTHRPPTIVAPDGREAREGRWITGHDLAAAGVWMYHLSLLFPRQVHEKCRYYGKARWARRAGASAWASDCYDRLGRPFRVHNCPEMPSWLERYEGPLPEAAIALWHDALAGRLGESLRSMDDVRTLLRSPTYRLGRALLRTVVPLVRRRNEPLRTWLARAAGLVRDRRRRAPLELQAGSVSPGGALGRARCAPLREAPPPSGAREPVPLGTPQ
ncbi:MAG: glycosyltransferase family A protein [Phycisphaerae bacterium]